MSVLMNMQIRGGSWERGRMAIADMEWKSEGEREQGIERDMLYNKKLKLAEEEKNTHFICIVNNGRKSKRSHRLIDCALYSPPNCRRQCLFIKRIMISISVDSFVLISQIVSADFLH